jgi:hypothetical protein
VFGVHVDGELVASAAALPYAGFGFVSMVLTTPAQRRRGFGTELLGCAVAALREAGLVPVLDATPAGRPVYERQGFEPIDALERWEGVASGTPGRQGAIALQLTALDSVAFGARRDFLFADLLERPGSIALVELGGCVVAREGWRAMQIGPLVADDEGQAIGLLGRMLDQVAGPVFLDVPARWTRLGAWLEGRGMRRQRPFTRMALGRGEAFGDPGRLFAAAGPEFG